MVTGTYRVWIPIYPQEILIDFPSIFRLGPTVTQSRNSSTFRFYLLVTSCRLNTPSEPSVTSSFQKGYLLRRSLLIPIDKHTFFLTGFHTYIHIQRRVIGYQIDTPVPGLTFPEPLTFVLRLCLCTPTLIPSPVLHTSKNTVRKLWLTFRSSCVLRDFFVYLFYWTGQL